MTACRAAPAYFYLKICVMLPAEEEELTSWEPRQIWPNDTSSIILLPSPVPPHVALARASCCHWKWNAVIVGLGS